MGKRVQLQTMLEEILGSRNVYFQPPANITLKYPCIIYKRTAGETRFADDKPYNLKTRYEVIVIDYDPDSEIPDKIAQLPTSVFERFYTHDNLNHDVYKLYY